MDTFTIDRVGGQGDGVAHTPAGPVFAALTLPGETVRGQVVDGRLEQIEIVTASADRVAPVSPQYGDCGGCSLQHWAQSPYLDWKRDQVRLALERERIDTDVEAAVELGMPVDVMDTNSRTLLVTAAFTANTNAIRALLKLGADPNRAMHTGMTALIYAAGEGHDDIVAMLLGAGARTNAHLHIRGSALEGYTPLHFACLQGRANAAKLLLEYGADPEPRDGKGQTPLQVAKKIVDGGSHKGLKPRDRARTRKQFEAIQALVDEAITKKAHGAIAGGGEL